jgi:hypothetical protein
MKKRMGLFGGRWKALTQIVLLAGMVTFCRAQTQTVIAPDLTGQALLSYIVANYKTATTLGYDKARDTLYSVIDLKPGNQLTCVYCGFTITLDPAADPSTDAFNKGINCEHSWPQSVGAADEPQRSDMHHLYPVKDNVNSSRNNEPYMEIPDADADVWFRNDVSQTSMPTSNLEEWAKKENGTPTGFEPRQASRGNVARSSFYFFAMYQAAADTNFWNLEKNVLYQWHYADAVDQDEYDRTYSIASYQDDKPNPFVLDSTLARRIWFIEGGGSLPSSEPTVLTTGDIVIVGVNCDDPDDFAFVPLVDLNVGTTINFTDNGWLSTNAFRTGEGTKTYTAPGAISAGTTIVYSENSSSFTSSGSFGLSASGDQLIAYQGSSSSPTMLFAVNISGAAVWQSDATNSNTSALPSGLTNGINCVALTEKDNVKYNGPTSGDKATILAAVSNKDNWIGDDGNRYIFTDLPDYSLPVTLTDFTANVRGREITLSWRTESETENLGFIIERREETGNRRQEAGEWKQVASYVTDEALQGHGSTAEAHDYSFADKSVQPGATYEYRLGDVDYGGTVTWHSAVAVTVPENSSAIPSGFVLHHAYPNPFNPETTLRFELSESARVSIQVFDLCGKPVNILTDDTYQPGAYKIIWNGRDARNRLAATGIYFLRISCGDFSRVEKVMFLR